MFIFLSLLFSLSSFAQEALPVEVLTPSAGTGSIDGVLLERGTRRPLADVNIFLLPNKIKAVTDREGKFWFRDLPAGECEMIINLTGYNRYTSKGECGKQARFTVYLEKETYSGFETTVTGKVKKRDDQTQSLTQAEFVSMPGSFGGDPVRAAQNLPGVASSGASAQIIVQGASPDDTGYLINGHRVPIVFHFGGLSSVITPQAVERVDLLPAGYGPEYSRAIGGIIGLTTTEPKKDRWHGLAFVDLLNAGALFEGPLDDKSSLLVSGRYSYIGQVLKAVAKENEDFELTAAPTYYDFTSIYQRQINEKNKFKTTIVASKDELELVLNKPANNDPDLRGNFYNSTEFFRIIPEISTTLDAKTQMDHSLGIGKDKIFFDIGGRYLDIDSNVLSHRSEIRREWSPKSKTFVGLDNYYVDYRVGINLPNSYSVGGVGNPFSVGENRTFVEDDESLQLGAYVRQELKPSDDSKWTFLPNLRFDHFSVNNDVEVQPRFQLRYQWDPSLLLRSSWGRYVQQAQPQETSRLYGNKDVRSPYAYHYTVGFTKDFRKNSDQGIELTNNYFYKELRDLVLPDVQENYSNTGSGTIIGTEVQAKYRKQQWSSQLVYTYLKSERHIPGFGTTPSEFDQTHNLNLIGAYSLERWTYSARFRFVTGNPYTPVNGGTFDADNDVYIPIRGGIYSRRFEAFNQLDIRVERKWIYDTWILTGYVDVQNIYNASNSQNIQYSYNYRDNKKIRGLPILPTVGVRGEF